MAPVFRLHEMDYLQADNEMQTFARLTGGRFYQPRFVGDMVDAFHDVSGDIEMNMRLVIILRIRN